MNISKEKRLLEMMQEEFDSLVRQMESAAEAKDYKNAAVYKAQAQAVAMVLSRTKHILNVQ